MKKKQILAIVMTIMLSMGSVMPAMAEDMPAASLAESEDTIDQTDEGVQETNNEDVQPDEAAGSEATNEQDTEDAYTQQTETQDADAKTLKSQTVESVRPQDVSEANPLAVGETFEIGDYTYEVIGDKEVKLSDYNFASSVGDVAVPGSIDYDDVSYNVTTIGSELHGWMNVTSFTMSEGITTIEKGAFEKYPNLTTINFPSTLKDYTGRYMPALSKMTMPDNSSYFTLKDGVLYNKNMTKLVQYPGNMPGDTYTIPSSVTTIGDSSLSGVQNLTNFNIPGTVQIIEDNAINMSPGIVNATVDNGVKTIQLGNFAYCDGLESLTINSPCTLGQGAISSCKNLKKITLGADIQVISIEVFSDLVSMEEYIVKDNCTVWSSNDGVLYKGNLLVAYPACKVGDTYIVPENTTSVMQYSFHLIKNLKTIIINPNDYLISGCVVDPVNPVDIYLRDTRTVNYDQNCTVFSLPQGSHIYVANQKIADTLLSEPRLVSGNSGAGFVEVKTIPATAIELTSSDNTLEKGKTSQAKATLTPYYSNETVAWSSSDDTIAKVDANGNITAVAKGTATITATASGQTATTKVTVTEPEVPLKGISLNKASTSLKKGGSDTLSVSYNPDNTTESKSVTWSSSDSKIATISDGKITAIAPGTAVITAKVGNHMATCKVTVTVPMTSIELNKTSASINKGKTIALSVTCSPADTTDSKAVSWTSSNNNVATVSSTGVVTGKGAGTATITGKVGNYTATCKVTVNVPMTGIKLDKTSITLEKGKSTMLKVTAVPSDTTEKLAATWTSSDKKVATVNTDGTVTGKEPGTATITAKSGDFTKTCKVTVPKATTPVKESGMDTLLVRRGNTYYFKYSLSNGEADLTIHYGWVNDQILVGDWDGDGVDSLCVRRGNTYYFKNSLASGPADNVIHYGRANDTILAGDWNGDGKDTLCVRRGNEYHVKNSISSGVADSIIHYGRGNDQILAGDWNGDGKDTLCVRRGNEYHFKNSISSGVADSIIHYGRANDQILAGDWNGDNKDTLCVRRGNEYHIKNNITSGPADKVVLYGRTNDITYTGTWKL